MKGEYSNFKNIVEQRALFDNVSKTYLIIKRLFDIFASLFGILLLSPVFLVTAAAIKVDSPGPVFFFSTGAV